MLHHISAILYHAQNLYFPFLYSSFSFYATLPTFHEAQTQFWSLPLPNIKIFSSYDQTSALEFMDSF